MENKNIEPIKTEYGSHRKKEVSQYKLDGTFVRTFESIADANRFLKINPKNKGIINTISGRQKSAHGYQWRYNNEIK